MQGLITRLRAIDYDVRTTQTFLLNSTQHPIESICSINHLKVQMVFAATWLKNSVRVRLETRFDNDRPKVWYENASNGFQLNSVLSHFILKVREADARFLENKKREHKESLASKNFAQLAKTLELTPDDEDPHTVCSTNFKVRSLPEFPTQVAVLVKVSHAQAIEIVRKYGWTTLDEKIRKSSLE
jgi:hypothetical protein